MMKVKEEKVKNKKTEKIPEDLTFKNIMTDELKAEMIFRSSLVFFFMVKLFILMLLFLTFIKPKVPTSASMSPTVKVNDYMFFLKTTEKQQLKRGNIVLFTLSTGDEIEYVKRVIGLPGEEVEVKENGDVYIDGKLLEEKYFNKLGIPMYGAGVTTVPENSYFLMGDNRYDSWDSRDFGAVNRENILGKLIVNIPLSKLPWK